MSEEKCPRCGCPAYHFPCDRDRIQQATAPATASKGQMLTEKKAMEIVKQYRDSKLLGFDDVHPNAKAYFLAEGFIQGYEDASRGVFEVLGSVSGTMRIMWGDLSMIRDGTSDPLANDVARKAIDKLLESLNEYEARFNQFKNEINL